MSDTSGQGDGRNIGEETGEAGEGRWEQGAGTVEPTDDGESESDALGRDPAETAGHERNPDGDLVSEGVQPDEKGHGDGEIEEREDQLTGPGGVQREREADQPVVYDPGRVGLEDGDGANPSDPGSYPNPDDQRAGTSRHEPELDAD